METLRCTKKLCRSVFLWQRNNGSRYIRYFFFAHIIFIFDGKTNTVGALERRHQIAVIKRHNAKIVMQCSFRKSVVSQFQANYRMLFKRGIFCSRKVLHQIDKMCSVSLPINAVHQINVSTRSPHSVNIYRLVPYTIALCLSRNRQNRLNNNLLNMIKLHN